MVKGALLTVFLISTLCFYSCAQTVFIKGKYCDLNGNKIAGLIGKQKSRPQFILFKDNQNGNQLELNSMNITWFVAGTDSFTVSHAPYLQKFPFLRVVVNEHLKLYVSKQVVTAKQSGATYNYNTDLYFYGANPDNLTEIKKENFVDAVSKIFVNQTALLKKIKDKEYKLDDMEEIVLFYNNLKVEEAKTKLKSKHEDL